MSAARRTWEAHAAALLAKCEVLVPPINVFELIHLCDITIEFIPLTDEASGTCFPAPRPGFFPTIFINSRHGWRRQRFTAAHELKHALFDDHARAHLKTPDTEQGANHFASGLLLPEMMVRSLIGAFGEVNSQLIADVFGVSRESAIYRLNNLGLIRNEKRDEMLSDAAGEKLAFEQLIAQGVPSGLAGWEILRNVVSKSDDLLTCPTCTGIVLDASDELCWRCGVSVNGIF